jgi:hypothetical protein
MARPLGGHPGEEPLEGYALGQLSGPDLEQVEDHLLVCEFCRERLQKLENTIGLIRDAARQLRDTPIRTARQTSDGPVLLEVERSLEGGWIASISGEQVQLKRSFETIPEANEYLLKSFSELFPESES